MALSKAYVLFLELCVICNITLEFLYIHNFTSIFHICINLNEKLELYGLECRRVTLWSLSNCPCPLPCQSVTLSFLVDVFKDREMG